MGTSSRKRRGVGQRRTLNNGLLRIEQAASYLGISKHSIYRLTCEKKIEFSKPNGKVIYFTQEALNEYAARNTQKAAA